jgi:hypothetical protein
MAFYLDIAKTMHLEALVLRGQKLYLEGKVREGKLALLDNWYSYFVTDNFETYEVVAPTIHLLSPTGENFFKVSKCECEYFHHYGYCPHLVAVLALLDTKHSSFFYSENLDSLEVNSNDIWQAISTNQKATIVNKYNFQLNALKEYSRSETWSYQTLTKNLGDLPKDLEKYPETAGLLEQYLKLAFQDYKEQKKALSLFYHNYLSAYKTLRWFSFFTPYLDSVFEQNGVKLILNLFINLQSGIYDNQSDRQAVKQEITRIIRFFDPEVLDLCLAEIKKNYAFDSKYWISFCFLAGLKDTLLQDLDLLEPKQMLAVLELSPENQDLIEQKILNQVKIWSDFLGFTGQASNSLEYKEIIEFFDDWYHLLGKTSTMEKAIEYYKEYHYKKKTLIKELLKFY